VPRNKAVDASRLLDSARTLEAERPRTCSRRWTVASNRVASTPRSPPVMKSGATADR
jgi:hypothetical protein